MMMKPIYGISLDRISILIMDGPLREIRIETLPVCESYLEDKMTKRLFSTMDKRAELPFRLVHLDICVLLNV